MLDFQSQSALRIPLLQGLLLARETSGGYTHSAFTVLRDVNHSKVLVVQKKKKNHHGVCVWMLPGGIIDTPDKHTKFDLPPRDVNAAIRETWEESGFRITEAHLRPWDNPHGPPKCVDPDVMLQLSPARLEPLATVLLCLADHRPCRQCQRHGSVVTGLSVEPPACVGVADPDVLLRASAAAVPALAPFTRWNSLVWGRLGAAVPHRAAS